MVLSKNIRYDLTIRNCQINNKLAYLIIFLKIKDIWKSNNKIVDTVFIVVTANTFDRFQTI